MGDIERPKCPHKDCTGEVQYVQQVTEFHAFTLLEDDDDYVDLIALESSYADDDFVLRCSTCDTAWGTIAELREALAKKKGTTC